MIAERRNGSIVELTLVVEIPHLLPGVDLRSQMARVSYDVHGPVLHYGHELLPKLFG